MLLQPQLVDLLDLLGGELECHGAQVVTHALFLAGRGQDNHILIDAPTQQDLALADGVFLGHAGEVVVEGSRGGFCDGR